MSEIKTLTEFFDAFATEEDCVRHLYGLRTQTGWTCPRCGAASPSLLLSLRKIQCTRCSCQQALTAHTVMYRSHVGLRKWFLAAYLVASDKRGISACRLARELKVKWVCAYYLLLIIAGRLPRRSTLSCHTVPRRAASC